SSDVCSSDLARGHLAGRGGGRGPDHRPSVGAPHPDLFHHADVGLRHAGVFGAVEVAGRHRRRRRAGGHSPGAPGLLWPGRHPRAHRDQLLLLRFGGDPRRPVCAAPHRPFALWLEPAGHPGQRGALPVCGCARAQAPAPGLYHRRRLRGPCGRVARALGKRRDAGHLPLEPQRRRGAGDALGRRAGLFWPGHRRGALCCHPGAGGAYHRVLAAGHGVHRRRAGAGLPGREGAGGDGWLPALGGPWPGPAAAPCPGAGPGPCPGGAGPGPGGAGGGAVNTILQAEGLTKYFGRMAAVDGVTLSVREGQLTAIIGPNGAGKTTFINLMSGFLTPDRGRIVFRDQDVTKLPPAARVHLGLTRSFQIMTLFPDLTAEENVLLPILARRGAVGRAFTPYKADREAREEAGEVLQRIGLWSYRDTPARLLSHGDQRLLELGIAVATRPVLCFLDEPTSGMNPQERRAVLDLVQELSASRTTTFVIVEHDMDEVFSLADYIYLLHRGQLLAGDTPEAIRQNPRVREVYLGEEVSG